MKQIKPIKYLSICAFLGLCYLIYACAYQGRRINERLIVEIGQHLTDNSPESALLLLDSIDTNILTDKQFSRYVISRIRTKDMLGLDISGDTTIIRERDYLIKKNDTENAATASYLVGCVLESQGKIAESIKAYQIAADWSERTNNYLRTGIIYYNMAKGYQFQHLYRESEIYLRKANKNYNLIDCKYEFRIWAIELEALNYLYLNKLDSALFCFESAANLALLNNDSWDEQRILQNSAYAFWEAKEYTIARNRCLKSISLTDKTDDLNHGRLQLTLASIHFETGQQDSAELCANKSMGLLSNYDNLPEHINLYALLSSIKTKNGQCGEALHYTRLYSDARQFACMALLENRKVNQDHTLQLIQAERDKYLKSNQNLYVMLIVLSLILGIAIIGFSFYSYINKSKKGKEKLEEDIATIKEIADNEVLKTIFQIKEITQLHILADADVKEIDIKSIRNLTDCLINKIKWAFILPAYNIKYDNLFDKIKEDHPSLEEEEYRILCLAGVGLGTLAIKVILDHPAPHTVQNKKTAIRKKLNLGLYANFQEHITKKYGIKIVE